MANLLFLLILFSCGAGIGWRVPRFLLNKYKNFAYYLLRGFILLLDLIFLKEVWGLINLVALQNCLVNEITLPLAELLITGILPANIGGIILLILLFRTPTEKDKQILADTLNYYCPSPLGIYKMEKTYDSKYCLKTREFSRHKIPKKLFLSASWCCSDGKRYDCNETITKDDLHQKGIKVTGINEYVFLKACKDLRRVMLVLSEFNLNSEQVDTLFYQNMPEERKRRKMNELRGCVKEVVQYSERAVNKLKPFLTIEE